VPIPIVAILNRIQVEKGAINIQFAGYPEYGSACRISWKEAAQAI
jgi:hypothetical protein